MTLLKKPSFGYVARLKDIRIINFTVSPEELRPFIPALPLVEINGRPIISMLDVSLVKLRPTLFHNLFGLTYRHIAFRVLVNDSHLFEDKISRGIFYLQSFANRSFIVNAGRLLTSFNFSHAEFLEQQNIFSLQRGKKYINYGIDLNSQTKEDSGLENRLTYIDRAYSIHKDQLRETRVKRSCLPLTPIKCSHFETNFFSSPELLASFQVRGVLEYQWLPPRISALQAQALQPVFASKFC